MVDAEAALPFDPADKDSGCRGNTGLHPSVQRSVFKQQGCREVCRELLEHPAHIVLPKPLSDCPVTSVLVFGSLA